MQDTASVRPQLVESLYVEALALSDEVRAVFDLSALEASDEKSYDPFRVALSCEALRATTRMMHAVAWLLNQRAYMRGELSTLQMHRLGKLTRLTGGDPERIAQLPLHLREMIEATETFYRHLQRFEEQWSESDAMVAAPVTAMQERLAEVFAVAS
ncbi:MAG: DUF1465 domain-containing protein [Sphingomonadales bacterium CG12_big_fil_rev_8_21_14_0_65_65_10]|nr:MAG: DUF1465 domain-containing protein [Sphingomonadales bacterium CG12_big_fil_rev_8_21_14_0_65_65_10]